MTDNPIPSTPLPDNPALPAGVVSTETTASVSPKQQRQDRIRAAIIIGVILLIIAGLITSIVLLVQADGRNPGTAALVRDIFIIFLGLVSLLVMVALTILMIQLAVLINLLQNEIKPILQSTTDTVNTLRGTTTFISNNMVEPIMKMNEYLAGLRRFLDLIRPGRL